MTKNRARAVAVAVFLLVSAGGGTAVAVPVPYVPGSSDGPCLTAPAGPASGAPVCTYPAVAHHRHFRHIPRPGSR